MKTDGKLFRSRHLAAIAGGVMAVALAGSLAASEKKMRWGYQGSIGPANWGKLHQNYKLCGTGRQQSPIDIVGPVGERTENVTISYKPGSAEILNNGHTIEVIVGKGSTLTVAGETYRLIQFHFHTPSENKIRGKQAPMEMHLVHLSASRKLAVIGVMIYPGGSHLIDRLPIPKTVGKPQEITGLNMNPERLLPPKRRYYAFMGSLTTPPCSEGVRWMVMDMPIRVSEKTLAKFRAVMGKNNRPLNPLNKRQILVNRLR